MAGKSKVTKPVAQPAPEPMAFGSREAVRVGLVLVGATFLLGAFLAPWWTRGMAVDEERFYEDAGDAGDGWFFFMPVGSEGLYLNYAPFHTPANGNIDYDASRAAAVAVLGLALVACALFCAAALAVRLLAHTKRIQENHDVAVRLAIVAFIAGLFAVLWGAFFLPLAGDNPGWLYGKEPAEVVFTQADGVAEAARYANVGFFLGIAGAVGFPAYLWFDAARTRDLASLGLTAGWTVGTPA